ncbi:hypothetical protein [Kribbella sp. C-35]
MTSLDPVRHVVLLEELDAGEGEVAERFARASRPSPTCGGFS